MTGSKSNERHGGKRQERREKRKILSGKGRREAEYVWDSKQVKEEESERKREREREREGGGRKREKDRQRHGEQGRERGGGGGGEKE